MISAKFARLRTNEPLVVILENVKGLLTMEDGKTFKKLLKKLESIPKYTVHWKIMNSEGWVPQHRQRWFA